MNPPMYRRRMSSEELQSAADHIRMGNSDYNPDEYRTLTVTDGMQNGHSVFTVTSSRGCLTEREENRAKEIFGSGGFVLPRIDTSVNYSRVRTDWHAEQRGIRARKGQINRRQASSNITPDRKNNPGVLHVGAACRGCAAAQLLADVINVTGTIESGRRINNPKSTKAWMRWRDG